MVSSLTAMDVVDGLNRAGITIASSELVFLAETEIPVSDASQASSLVRFIDELEDLEDVQSVFANFDIEDRVLEAMEAG